MADDSKVVINSGDRAGERRVGRRDTPLELDRRRRNRLQPLERFTATLERNDRGGTTAEIPFDVAAEFGSVRAPVLVTINGFKFRTRTMRYGGVYLLGLNREAREGAGVDAGDTVAVELELDQAPHDVTFRRAGERARGRTGAARLLRLPLVHASTGVRALDLRGEARRDAPPPARAGTRPAACGRRDTPRRPGRESVVRYETPDAADGSSVGRPGMRRGSSVS